MFFLHIFDRIQQLVHCLMYYLFFALCVPHCPAC